MFSLYFLRSYVRVLQEWAVNYRRPDLVGLLLVHGASAPPELWEELQWDAGSEGKEEAEAAKAESDVDAAAATGAVDSPSSGPHRLTRSLNSAVYASEGHLDDRKWGLRDALLVEACQYAGESDSAACKRLLFQQRLAAAVDAEPSGDLGTVTELVGQWRRAELAGRRLRPLCYRWDAFRRSPLATAACYEPTNNAILAQLLSLPHCFHVQPASAEFPPLHQAVCVQNKEGVEMLLDGPTRARARGQAAVSGAGETAEANCAAGQR